MKTPKRRMSATNVIIFGFLAIIFVGTLLLVMPFSSKSGEFTNPITALFTATSATCVTGLITVDTGIYWSAIGKAVIILLIQVGGLGFMSLAMVFSTLLKRRVSPREQVLFTQSMNLDPYSNLSHFAYRVTLFAFSAEAMGALLLSFRFIPQFGMGKGIIYSVFHSISAFCNAGFDIMGGEFGEFASIAYYSDDVYVSLVLMLLILSGGLGFVVWDDILHFLKERRRVSFYSKLVIWTSLLLVFGGALVITVAEFENPETLGTGSVFEKFFRALFQSVTLRTAGFAAINQGALRDGTKIICMLLMFIGGNSGSTAGGIKISTLVMVLASTVSIIRGDKTTVIGRRRFEEDAVRRAFALFVIGVCVAVSSGFIISGIDGVPILDALFETFSAFGTVGITVGITPHLTVISKLAVAGLMFFGRIGITSVMYAILMRANRERVNITYPRLTMPVG